MICLGWSHDGDVIVVDTQIRQSQGMFAVGWRTVIEMNDLHLRSLGLGLCKD